MVEGEALEAGEACCCCCWARRARLDSVEKRTPGCCGDSDGQGGGVEACVVRSRTADNESKLCQSDRDEGVARLTRE